MAISVTTIAAHALDANAKEIADAIINNNLLSAWLKANGRVKTVSGGLQFNEKVMYNEAGGYDWINKDEEIPLSTTEFLTDAVYQIRILAGPLKIYHFDKMRASGEAQIFDLVETTIENAKSTMSNRMGAAVFGDNGTSSKILHGIQHIINTTAGVSVGGISPSDFARWENQRITTGTASFGSNQAGLSIMRNLASACARNENDYPDLMVTTSAIWGLYYLACTNVARLQDSKVGSLGYKTLDFMGIPVGWDQNCPADNLYAVNSRYLRLRVLEGGEFVTSDWERVQGQLADYATMHVYCQLTTNNREKLGVATSITG
ncbi:MAG: phage major capsid protein [Pseudomonadota bacterium]